jgi:hypothetical protein
VSAWQGHQCTFTYKIEEQGSQAFTIIRSQEPAVDQGLATAALILGEQFIFRVAKPGFAVVRHKA